MTAASKKKKTEGVDVYPKKNCTFFFPLRGKKKSTKFHQNIGRSSLVICGKIKVQ